MKLTKEQDLIEFRFKNLMFIYKRDKLDVLILNNMNVVTKIYELKQYKELKSFIFEILKELEL